jgi:hypothetical protein
MENLEKNLSIDGISTKNLVAENTSKYEGLTLIEEIPYNGPTSIKYWM